MRHASCPDAETLASCASGEVEPAVVVHLGECPACARVVEALRGEDGPLPARETSGDPEPGDSLGRYVLVARLGAGGMGVVWSAYDPVLDRMVALKSIRADRVSPDLARRFEREAQALARLTHPHLVRVFDAGVDRGRLYLAMELVGGGGDAPVTLGAWLEQPRSTAQIVRVFREIAEALVAVHAAGLVHRDVKPDNILVDASGYARLADFGLVAPAGGTTETFAVGTPNYMSPEQRTPGAAIDARSDQWSWARAFDRALREPSPRLRRLIDRAAHDDPARRYPDMAAVVRALSPRRLAWPLVAGAVAAQAIVLVVVLRPEATDPCAIESDGAWSRGRTAIAKAFEASDHPAWRARLEATGRAVQAVTAALDTVEVATCQHARLVKRSGAAERVCLEDRRADVRALLVALGSADRAMVDQAPLAATRLSRGAECVAPGEVVADPEAARPLAAELATLRARFALGARKDLLAALEALARRTAELGAPQLEGEVKLLLGEVQSRLRDDEAAAATLGEAASAAARARDDRVVALARLLQAGQAALLTTNPERAKALGEVAAAAVERAGNPVELRGQLENVLGGIAFSRGDFAGAERHYRACLAARVEAFGADHPTTAAAHQNIGIALGRIGGRADEARTALETAIAILERTVGEDHPDLAVPLNSLGTNAADAKRYDDATRHFERALALRIANLGPDHPEVAVSHNNLGKLAKLRGRPRDGLAHYTRALAIVEGKLGKDVVEVALPLSGLAALHADLGEWSQARAFSERAIAVTEAKRGPDHPALVSMLVTYANILDHGGERERRRATLERAHAIAKAKLGATHAQTAEIAALLAR